MGAVITRTVTLDGGDYVLDEAGVGGRPLLLHHGFTGGRNDFTDLLPGLGELGWHAVAYDARGHGASVKYDRPEDYAPERFVDDALALADELGWADFTLLGHSFGGMVAQELTLAAPDRVRALVLMDTGPRSLPVDPQLVELGVSVALEQGLDVLVELMRDIEDPLANPAYERACREIPGYRERGEENTRVCSPVMYAAVARFITTPHDRLDRLAAISCPTLIVVGEHDTPFIAASEAMAATIPGAELVVLPDGGHSPQFECPEAYRAALTAFLASVAGQVELAGEGA